MTIEQQVCSLELAKKLKELGVKQESYWYWVDYKIVRPAPRLQDCYSVRLPEADYYSAFTVAELGEILPSKINLPFKNGKKRSKDSSLKSFFGKRLNTKNVIYTRVGQEYIYVSDKTEADARAKMLIYLIENKLITL